MVDADYTAVKVDSPYMALRRECTVGCLDAADMWSVHDSYLFRSPEFLGSPFFYPIYRWHDFYSFSPFLLLLKKKRLTLNAECVRYLEKVPGDVSPSHLLIDSEIERIGGPPQLASTIRDQTAFAEAMARAIQDDAVAIESRNPGKTNVVLCGGKDSLNLLLLQWRNPVVAYSAEPNYPLVRMFVEDNDLDIEVRRLEDRHDPAMTQREIAEAFCQVELSHWKWTAHLVEIAREFDREVVFWKGQFADAFFTDYWRSYTSSPSPFYRYFRRGYRKAAHMAPGLCDFLFAGGALADFRRSIWERGAVLQGAHMGFLRSITDCLVVSAYHGPETANVWHSADLPRVANNDVRPLVGRILAGREVVYPADNPSPPASEFRRGLRRVDAFVNAVGSFGVAV